MIQYVEGFPAYLQVLSFGELKLFAESSVVIGDSVQAQMVTPTRAVVFQQRLTYWKASRYRVIRKERHGVQLRGVAVHCRVDGRAAVVRAVYNSNAEPLQVLFESLFRPLPFLRT